MSLKAGTYSFTASNGKLFVYTFKEGLLSKIAHDLLIEVTNFSVNLSIPETGLSSASIKAEIQSNSLKVICAMKDGQRQPETLKENDKADIEKAILKDVLHPAKYPAINFSSSLIQEKEGGYVVKGEFTLHGVTKTIEFDLKTENEKNLKTLFTIPQKDYGIKPFKALMGTLKVKNEVNVSFELPLS